MWIKRVKNLKGLVGAGMFHDRFARIEAVENGLEKFSMISSRFEHATITQSNLEAVTRIGYIAARDRVFYRSLTGKVDGNFSIEQIDLSVRRAPGSQIQLCESDRATPGDVQCTVATVSVRRAVGRSAADSDGKCCPPPTRSLYRLPPSTVISASHSMLLHS